LVPELGGHGEQKTKPTQHSVRDLRALGLNPDIIVCRSTTPLEETTRDKISRFCHVRPENVIGCHDVSNLYRVPLLLLDQLFPLRILNILSLFSPSKQPRLASWKLLAAQVDEFQAQATGVRIGIIGKYTGLPDAYLSVIKGLQHGSHFIGRRLFIEWIEASDLEECTLTEHPKRYEQAWASLKSVSGILVPGGFGNRGVEGKVLAAKYARESKIPYFGICYGLQIAVIEYARNVLGWKTAHSEEWEWHPSTDLTPESRIDKVDPNSPHRLVVFMPEISKTHMGGTMRLGARKTFFKDKNSLTSTLYAKISGPHDGSIMERHRHRYEVNPLFVDELSAMGLKFVGQDETGVRQEIIELEDHPYFVGVQYHPEMKSRPIKPSPVFAGFMLAAAGFLPSFLKGEWRREPTSFEQASPDSKHIVDDLI